MTKMKCAKCEEVLREGVVCIDCKRAPTTESVRKSKLEKGKVTMYAKGAKGKKGFLVMTMLLRQMQQR